MEVSNPSSPLRFSGFHIYPDTPVRVKAYNFSRGRYDVITSGRSFRSALPPGYWDDPLYEWSAPSRVLGSAYWQPGRCRGARALVKGETDVSGRTYGMYSWNLARNTEGCMNTNRNNSDWVRNCSSPSSNLRTTDYSDTPRASGVTITALPEANATCAGVTFRYQHPADEWSDVQGSYRRGTTTWGLSCAPTFISRGTTYGRCQLNLGGPAGVEAFIDALRSTSGTLTITARDERCRDRLRASRTATVRSSSYDYNWPRWSGFYPQCAAPPPPPPPPQDLRLRSVQCFCTNVGGVNGLVNLSGCFDDAATNPSVGAALMCGYASVALENSSGLDTTCALSSLGSPGATCGYAGEWNFTP